jgi:hypothetical protein
MRLIGFGLLAGAIFTAHPAWAQDATAVPTAAMIERMCSSAGASQYVFGQTGVPGASKAMRSMTKGLALPASAAPFDHAKPWSTEWSDRLFAIEYTAPLLAEDAFDGFAEDLDAILWDAGWEAKPADYDPPLYMMTATGDWTWTRPDPTAPEPAELVLGLSNLLGNLTLTCGRSDLMRAHAEEALGELPPGTPRPTVPDVPVPPLRSEADCAQADVVAEMEALLASDEANSFMAQMVARTTYRDRLTSWMLWKLDKSGKISSDRLLELSFSAVGSASPGGNPFAQFEMIGEMLELIEPIAVAEEAHDASALCRALVPLEGWMARVDALTFEQTEATQSALTAEAARLGVSLD